MEIKIRFKIGARVCFIEDGKMLFDEVRNMTVYVNEDGTHSVIYYFKSTGTYKWEGEILPAAK